MEFILKEIGDEEDHKSGGGIIEIDMRWVRIGRSSSVEVDD